MLNPARSTIRAYLLRLGVTPSALSTLNDCCTCCAENSFSLIWSEVRHDVARNGRFCTSPRFAAARQPFATSVNHLERNLPTVGRSSAGACSSLCLLEHGGELASGPANCRGVPAFRRRFPSLQPRSVRHPAAVGPLNDSPFASAASSDQLTVTEFNAEVPCSGSGQLEVRLRQGAWRIKRCPLR